MVILHVLSPGTVGGLERVVEGLARGHRLRGHQVHVASILDGPWEPPLHTALRDAGVAVHSLVMPPRAYWRERSAVGALCRRLAPDVVHTHGYRCDVLDAGVARRTGIPTVTTVHGFTFGGWKNRVYEAIQRAAFRRFDAVVAVSRPLAGELARAGVPAGRIRVVPNAWGGGLTAFERATARRLLGVPDGRFHVGWVGRLSWEKGADVFLDAVAALADLPLSVSLFGHGAERGRLEAQARRLGLHRATTLRGNVPHAERLFSAFDCFVLSSRTEGTPIALFEAMAAGVPVVTSAVGGVPDVVSPAEALLVQPCLPSALAEAIRAVYHHPADAQERAVRARARLRAFDPEPWLTRYEQVYESVSHSPALAGHTR